MKRQRERKLGFILFALIALIALTFEGCQQAGLRQAANQTAPPGSNGLAYSTSNPSARAQRLNSAAHARQSAPPGSLPALDEEVWVIIKPPPQASNQTIVQNNEDETPGCGSIICGIPDPAQPQQIINVPLPLKHTEVTSHISAYIASVEVKQEFFNPYESKIEAVYVFPLPENAAVNGFIMTIGDRHIRGIIREREEANRIYNEAKSQGYVASLLTQERPNIFTQRVANIEPLKQVDVNITYFHTLSYDDGWYEFVFPMVVGPRFNPPAPGMTDGVGAVARGAYGASGQSTEVQYLKPHERSGHDIGLTVDINAGGVPIEEIVCTSHQIDINNEYSEQVRIALRETDRIPNKDFVLRYRIAGDQVKTALLTHADSAKGENYFTLMLIPPRDITNDHPRQPMEMIFVIDCSGSMSGEPIKQAKAAIEHALSRLEPHDTFQIIQFSNNASQFGSKPLPATKKNLKKGRDYVRNLRGEGGTYMIEGIKAALDFPHDPERLRFVTFLTDGYIGNEAQILGEIHTRIVQHENASRIFSFGVGSSPNRFLTDRMAKLGRGAVAYLSLKDDGAKVMDAFFSRVSHPVLSDVRIDFGDMNVTDALPANGQIPDLFVGRPVIVTGKFTGTQPGTIKITGRAAGQHVQSTINVDPNQPNAHPAIACIWARMHIAELMDQATHSDNAELPQQIKTIALNYNLMSAYTSFVAVDSSTRTAGESGTTVHVAVPVPEGVKYETTVAER